MKAAFLVVVFLAAIAHSQMSDCATNYQFTISTDAATFGCQGYANSVTVVWTLSSSDSRLLAFTSFNTENNYDKVTIVQGATQWGPWSGTNNPGSVMLLGGSATVTFTSDGSNTDPGFTIVMTRAPDVISLLSGQQITMQPKQDGGFVYFQIGPEAYGSALYVNTFIHSYEGLQPPTLFIGVNRIPTLENYDYTNSTVPYEDGYQAFQFVNTPAAGTYYIGLFLYGTSTDIDIEGYWTFNVPVLTSGQQVSNSTSSVPVIYQVSVPTGTSDLVFQISRQVPGGYPIAYIQAGSIPSMGNYEYAMDTSMQSYIKLTIPEPNPYNNASPNPGNWLIAVYDNGSLDYKKTALSDSERAAVAAKGSHVEPESFQPLSSGFILQVNWF